MDTAAVKSCLFAFASALVLVAACMPDEKAFEERVFYCDSSQAKSGCGTTNEGAPLTCYPSKQLGATLDFCVEPCSTTTVGATDSDAVCLDSTAKVKTCRPSEKTAADPDGCGPNLACYRTDLVEDEGLCLPIRVCSSDSDCKDPTQPTCAATLVKALYPNLPLKTDNLQCLVAGCQYAHTSCPTGETCLPSVIPSTTELPDICVPSCDSNLNCPPNYTCWRRLSGPKAPNVCLPAIPGTRCSGAFDCIVGECLPTDAGFSMCAIPCEHDEECVAISASSRKQFCVAAKGTQKYCIAINPLDGEYCSVDSPCPEGQKCFFTSPYHAQPMDVGECRLPCGDDARCPVRAGIRHSCFVRDDDRSCYPGLLGVTCKRSEDCLEGMTCESLSAEQRPGDAGAGGEGDAGAGADADPVASRVCTLPCHTDGDCVDLWGQHQGYCEASWCRLSAGTNEPCTRDQQCRDGACTHQDGAVGTCKPAK
jgi:hypothetical protein